ncbi:MAG: hypothetical protein A4E28_01844 [Methanocella sp. PtaU1.Bin125]|nr:MAG: hypothetical protein A4E28_01844 [Methanocella sp. PtaU1.Bin125]
MASDIIGNAIVAIAAIIIVTVLIIAIIPDVYNAAFGIQSTAADAGDRVTTSVLVTNHCLAAPGIVELDLLNNGKGSLSESTIDLSVVYLGNASMPSNRLPLGGSGAGQYWNYTNIGRNVTGDTDGHWDPGETLVVSLVSPGYSFAPGEYEMKMILYNNALCQYRFRV